jgi:class 3 adenylate cyclase
MPYYTRAREAKQRRRRDLTLLRADIRQQARKLGAVDPQTARALVKTRVASITRELRLLDKRFP